MADKLRQVIRDLRFGQLMLLLQFGNMDKQLAKYNSRLYAEQVMPQLQDVWSEWENHWWPTPMAAADRAAPDPIAHRAVAAE